MNDETELMTTADLGVDRKKLRAWVRMGLCTPTLRMPDKSFRWNESAAANVYRVRDYYLATANARHTYLGGRTRTAERVSR
ncbi:MAG: hypothetical protein K8U57_18505 [Planctomycetes bacterium]|nr:hypothetical protein [Planctomycetota bacterium]